MKKVFLFSTVLLLIAGCTAKDEYFTKTCINKIKSKNLLDSLEEKVTYNNKDKVTNIQIIRKYKGKNKQIIENIKKSIEPYNNDLLKNKNIKINIVTDKDDTYSLKYTYDVTKMKNEELEKLNIDNNSVKYLKELKKEGLTCN